MNELVAIPKYQYQKIVKIPKPLRCFSCRRFERSSSCRGKTTICRLCSQTKTWCWAYLRSWFSTGQKVRRIFIDCACFMIHSDGDICARNTPRPIKKCGGQVTRHDHSSGLDDGIEPEWCIPGRKVNFSVCLTQTRGDSDIPCFCYRV